MATTTYRLAWTGAALVLVSAGAVRIALPATGAPPALTDSVAVLDSAVRGMVDGGTLPPQTGRPLLGLLKRAGKLDAAGNGRAAAGLLAAFARRIDALTRKGLLTASQGDALGAAARGVGEASAGNVRGRIAPTGGSGVARGDFDHDGFGDLAVASPNRTVDGKAGAGAVFVIHGTAAGLSAQRAQIWTEDSVGAQQRASRGAHFGSALASGDFDGDGFTDLAIGVPDADGGAGHVDVLFGSASGLGAERTQRLDLGTTPVGQASGGAAQFGAALAWANFDGDAFGDLAVGAPGMDATVPGPGAAPVLVRGAGLVCVFFGSADGLLAPNGAAARTPQLVSPHGASVAAGLDPDPANAGDRFGSALAAGKLDPDGYADLAIGAPFADVTLPTGIEGVAVPLPAETNYVDAGRVQILSGSAAGLVVAGAETITQDTFLAGVGAGQPGRSDYRDQFGTALCAGDFDGDAAADLAVGAPFRDAFDAAVRVPDTGAVYVLYAKGSAGPGQRRHQVWAQGGALGETPEAGDRFGSAVAAGDLDGDGKRDLAVGVPFEDLADAHGAPVVDCGVVHVLYGTAAGLDASRAQILRRAGDFADAAIVVGTDAARGGDRFGAALTAWNFNGVPSPAELAVGAPYADVGGRRDAGVVHVVYGRSGGLDGSVVQSWRASDLGSTDAAGALFGATEY